MKKSLEITTFIRYLTIHFLVGFVMCHITKGAATCPDYCSVWTAVHTSVHTVQHCTVAPLLLVANSKK